MSEAAFFAASSIFMDYIYDSYGVKRKISVVSAANKLATLKKQSGSNPWPVIEECFIIWEKTHPSKYDSYLLYLDDIKTSRNVTTVGNSQFTGVQRSKDGAINSYVADIPKQVMHMIRAVYDPNELPMNKEFWTEFIKRYPHYAIRKKV